MSARRRLMRYGHTEGYTAVCFDSSGRFIVTCGYDGDVRIWDGFDDDDPKSIRVGEKVLSVAVKDNRMVTAVSNNAIQSHSFPDGLPDGVLARFTAPPVHLDFSSSGGHVAAGASDFVIKMIAVDTLLQTTFIGHEAPVLSVAFDPKEKYLGSSSCDGTVCIWDISSQSRVVSWPILTVVNDVKNAPSLCRLSWQPGAGQYLAVPVSLAVRIYQRDTWTELIVLTAEGITQPVMVATWSPCGRYLSAASANGQISVWDWETKCCRVTVNHEKGYGISAMAWNPLGNGQIAYTDNRGQLGLLEAVMISVDETQDKEETYEDLFDQEVVGSPKWDQPTEHEATEVDAHDDVDEDVPVLSRGRQRLLLFEEDSHDTDSLAAGSDVGVKTKEPPLLPVSTPVYQGPLPTTQQKAFQPSSTPSHLSHRFMVWNFVAIARSYNDNEDSAIEVEFHDVSVHHAIHVPNTLNHHLADVSAEALLLGCESSEQFLSKVQCLHFGSWDGTKEWLCDLPQGEEVRALCLGGGWAAVASNIGLLRIFSLGGLQRQVIRLPGPIVALAGHRNRLLIAYHRGVGFDGEQNLGVLLLDVSDKGRSLIDGSPLPLSIKSYLVWLGFSLEGSPAYMDSAGHVCLLPGSMGNMWLPICDTRQHCKGSSDHYWLIGVQEVLQQIRCVPCKGSRFPPILPRPIVTVLPFQLPMCQLSTEKGQLEEQYWRSRLLSDRTELASNGYCSDEHLENISQQQQESLMKLFALSCRAEREFRCIELAQLMAPAALPLAIKYASRARHRHLAERLGELARELARQAEESPERPSQTSPPRDFNGGGECSQDDDRGEDSTSGTSNSNLGQWPTALKKPDLISSPNTTLFPKTTPTCRNPFKVTTSVDTPSPKSGSRVGDSRSNKKVHPSKSSPEIRPLPPMAKPKQATIVGSMKGKRETVVNSEPASSADLADTYSSGVSNSSSVDSSPKLQTAFQLWMEENRERMLADKPDLDDEAFLREGMSAFRALTATEKKSWNERAKASPSYDTECKKRKQQQPGEPAIKKTKTLDSRTAARLSAFAFKE
uniref:WD repeat and HMG-box DNA-binding protein 1 isoform X2 n=1 Tax=Myxine glutinosa TaxID=7769 RepID=UPI00358E3A74